MILYRLLLGLAAAAAGTLLVFFLWGLTDGSVGRQNMPIWLAMLAVAGGVIGAALTLRSRGQTLAASLVLLVLALPAGLAALFLLLAIILQPRWN